MVDDVTKLGELLRLPDLEEETKALINKKMREMIDKAEVVAPSANNPLRDKDIMNEWINGKQKEGE